MIHNHLEVPTPLEGALDSQGKATTSYLIKVDRYGNPKPERKRGNAFLHLTGVFSDDGATLIMVKMEIVIRSTGVILIKDTLYPDEALLVVARFASPSREFLDIVMACSRVFHMIVTSRECPHEDHDFQADIRPFMCGQWLPEFGSEVATINEVAQFAGDPLIYDTDNLSLFWTTGFGKEISRVRTLNGILSKAGEYRKAHSFH